MGKTVVTHTRIVHLCLNYINTVHKKSRMSIRLCRKSYLWLNAQARYPWWQHSQIIVLSWCLISRLDLPYCSETERETLYSIFSFLYLQDRVRARLTFSFGTAVLFRALSILQQSSWPVDVVLISPSAWVWDQKAFRGLTFEDAGQLWNFQVLGKVV